MDTELLNYINERALNIERYSEKISTCLKEIDSILTPTIKQAGLNFTDPYVLYKIDDSYSPTIKYRLSVRKESKNKHAGLYVEIDTGEYEDSYESPWNVSSGIQKLIIRRLPEFMREYSQYVSRLSEDYFEVSDIAENILNAVKEPAKYRKYGSQYKLGE